MPNLLSMFEPTTVFVTVSPENETLMGEFLIDFDLFTAAALRLSYGAELRGQGDNFNGFGALRVRLAATSQGLLDGATIASENVNSGMDSPAFSAGQKNVPFTNPKGVKFLSVTTQGTPQAIASPTTFGNASPQADDKHAMSSAGMNDAMSSTSPKRCTFLSSNSFT